MPSLQVLPEQVQTREPKMFFEVGTLQQAVVVSFTVKGYNAISIAEFEIKLTHGFTSLYESRIKHDADFVCLSAFFCGFDGAASSMPNEPRPRPVRTLSASARLFS